MSSSTEIQKSQKLNMAIPFVTFDDITKKFIINEDAIKIISKEENKQIGILSLVGKYRTGKSFLLNRVLIEKKSSKGFEVAPTIKPCTKGIWLWSSPLIINNNYSNKPFPAYLIDTEGLGAYDEEINHDSKIFLIAILISSLFIYNSFGTIDEVALNNLSLILNLSKSLKIRNNSNTLDANENEGEEMAKYFPSLLWILRDFALKLEDSEGNVITAKQYLENALMEQKGSSESIEEKNLVRKMIKTYFLERDCFPMVRPVEGEKELQKLMTLSDSFIRPEFLRQCEMLRNKIYMKIKPKTFNGQFLSGQMLINLLRSIIDAINEGAIPVIENSWKYITNNECMKIIRENVEYFKKLILEYQKNNISSSNFFNDLQEFSQSMIEEIVNKFKEENEKRFEDINDYVHKLKLSLNQEFKKLNEENISLLKDKYILDLDKEINSLLSDKEKLMNSNYINFISNLLQIKYKLDATIPHFSLKEQISYDKIIDSIKKYIEDYFVKPKNGFEQEIQNLQLKNQILEEKLKNVSDEYKKDKEEFKQTVNNYNNMLIENKMKLNTSEEKVKNFEKERKLMKENNERNVRDSIKKYQDKIEKMKMEMNKLKMELKAKEEDLLVNKLNDDKITALNTQKINLLEKECEQWKERYNSQNKELSENKNIIINLNSELDKLKTENKNLKNKNGKSGIDRSKFHSEKKLDIHRDFVNNLSSKNSTTNNVGNNVSAANKLLIELLTGQNAIKDYLKELMDKTNDLYEKNQSKTSNFSKILNNTDHKYNYNYNERFTSYTSKNTSSNKFSRIVDNNNNKILNQTQTKKNLRNGSFSKVLDKREEKDKYSLLINKNKDDNNFKKNDLEIKVINSVLKKDLHGKQFLEYVCEVKKGDKNYKINKKLGHFIMLHKALKSIFKDNLVLANGGNLFININEMNQNSFHENKLEQLNKYVSDLINLEEVVNSLPFTNFFELNEEHELNNNDNLDKYKMLLEKNK